MQGPTDPRFGQRQFAPQAPLQGYGSPASQPFGQGNREPHPAGPRPSAPPYAQLQQQQMQQQQPFGAPMQQQQQIPPGYGPPGHAPFPQGVQPVQPSHAAPAPYGQPAAGYGQAPFPQGVQPVQPHAQAYGQTGPAQAYGQPGAPQPYGQPSAPPPAAAQGGFGGLGGHMPSFGMPGGLGSVAGGLAGNLAGKGPKGLPAPVSFGLGIAAVVVALVFDVIFLKVHIPGVGGYAWYLTTALSFAGAGWASIMWTKAKKSLAMTSVFVAGAIYGAADLALGLVLEDLSMAGAIILGVQGVVIAVVCGGGGVFKALRAKGDDGE